DFVAKETPSMDTDYLDLMQQAIAGIGWDGRSNLTPSDKSASPGSRWVRGRGMALSLRHGSQGGGSAYAMATMARARDVTSQQNDAADPPAGFSRRRQSLRDGDDGCARRGDDST